MGSVTAACPLCMTEGSSTRVMNDLYRITCAVCGEYDITGSIEASLGRDGIYEGKRAALSALARRATEQGARLFLVSSEMDQILAGAPGPRIPTDVIDDVLLRLADRTHAYGVAARLPATDYAVFFLTDRAQLSGVVQLMADLHLVKVMPTDVRSDGSPTRAASAAITSPSPARWWQKCS